MNEDRVLQLLNASDTDLLDDTELIDNLEMSKATAFELQKTIHESEHK